MKGGGFTETAVALGTFDGIHSGHRAVLEKTLDFYSVAVTFRIPPKSVMGKSPDLLMQPDERLAAFREFGIDEVLCLEFEEVRDMLPIDFLKVVFNKYSPSRICCGFNYHFGRAAGGNCETIARYCREKGIEFICCDPVSYGGQVISSTYIRSLIEKGDIIHANRFLFKPFSFSSPVINGDHRGRTLGFPTANQVFPKDLVKPGFGVYASSVFINGREYKGVTNIGIRPSFMTDYVGCETYIFDFKGELYNKNIRLMPHYFIRPEKSFSNLEELKSAISNDIKTVLNIDNKVGK